MPLYLVERTYSEKLSSDASDVARLLDVNSEEGIHWLFSFLSADETKGYCLYEAPNPEAIRTAARRLGLPADAIIEVNEANPLDYLSRDEIVQRTGKQPRSALG